MVHKDIIHNIKVEKTIQAIVLNDDTEGTGLTVDTYGYDSVMAVVNIGISADTLSGSVKFIPVFQHGDAADGSDMAAVDAADLYESTFATVDAAAEDDVVQICGYKGTKRYVRVFIDTTGTHTNGTPMSANILLGHASRAPVV